MKPVNMLLLVPVCEGCSEALTRKQGENSTGPAKVTSEAYRQGWDSIFGKKQEVGQA